MALTTFLRRCALTAALTLPLAASAGTGQIFIVNTDGPGEGFNDPTPAAPVGGNPGTTVGQQRLIAFQYAADIWGAVLDTDVDIYIRAAFNPLACTATSAVLGSAGSLVFNRDFDGAEIPATWYHIALANKLEGVDAIPPGTPGLPHEDIQATFNSILGTPGCFTGSGWYYGLDHNEGNLEDLVAVLMHEFGHGLGFANRISEDTGVMPGGFPDIYTAYTYDNTQNKRWTQMTNAERVTSAINGRRVAWDGINVTRSVPARLALGVPTLTVSAPAAIAGEYLIGPAAFGPAFPTTPLSAPVVLGLDAVEVGGTATNGCSPLTNAAEVAGKIVLVDRGLCTFNIKVKNAQDAGAVAVLVADNVAGTPPANLAGTDPTITIPSGRITLADGNIFKANLAGLVAALGVDMSRRQGADAAGRALLYAVDPVALGSSISHFDTSASPNLLMEPFINDDLTDDLDLTLPLMTDIGWFSDYDGVPDGEDACIGSDRRETVVVGSCDSGAANLVFADGCRVSDRVAQCKAGAASHGGFVSCVGSLSEALKNAGMYSGRDHGKLTSCVAGSK